MSNWIQDAEKEMEDKGTVGAFTKQAKVSGMTVQEFAMKVKENPSDYTETTRKRAQFALNMEKIAKQNKMAQGGETQGYNDELNEDLGTRLGRESGYSQSLKDRRDESKAGNKTLGRRAYSSVETMDKGDKMFMQGGQIVEIPYEKALKIFEQGEIDVYGVDENGKELVIEYKEDFNEFEMFIIKQKFAKGGKTQGYDDRDRESIGERNKGVKSQSLDSRMRESAGTEKSMGRRKYADVSTMDEGDRKMARGGSVKGKIDRDRYVKLRREKDKEIAKLKKEKGALRKETLKESDKDCDTEVREVRKDFDKEVKDLKKDIGRKVAKSVAVVRKKSKRELDELSDDYDKLVKNSSSYSKSEDNQTLLIGGIAGILFGAFLIGR